MGGEGGNWSPAAKKAGDYTCRPCVSARVRKWKKENPDKANKGSADRYRRWRENNPEGYAASQERRKNKDRAPRVYVLTHPCWPALVKIGMTTHPPKKRLLNFNVSDPFKRFEFASVVEVRDAVAVEKQLHETLDKFHVGGEWYEVDVEVATRLLGSLRYRKEPNEA